MSETRRLLLEFETEEVGIRASKDKRVKKALVSAFSDASDVVRERALLAAIDVGDPTIVTDIIKAMTDEEVRTMMNQFASVSPSDNLITTWADIKSR